MHFLRVVVLAFAMTASGQAVAASPADELIAALPRVWFGQLIWRGTSGHLASPQSYLITFTCVEKRRDGKVEVTGPAEIRAGRRVNRIEIRATIDPATRSIEMIEKQTPRTEPGFTSDGSHQGAVGPDYKSMSLEWTTNRSETKGDLRLTAQHDYSGQLGGVGPAEPCRTAAM